MGYSFGGIGEEGETGAPLPFQNLQLFKYVFFK